MEENVYKKARLNAAAKNPDFSSVEKAYPLVCISREKLLMIEQSDPRKKRATPNPEEVVMLADAYGAPELCDHYCSHDCPLGRNRSPLVYDDLGKISAGLMSSLHFLEAANDDIHAVLADSEISGDELARFKNILKTLKNISYNASSLELWAEKNRLLD